MLIIDYHLLSRPVPIPGHEATAGLGAAYGRGLETSSRVLGCADCRVTTVGCDLEQRADANKKKKVMISLPDGFFVEK